MEVRVQLGVVPLFHLGVVRDVLEGRRGRNAQARRAEGLEGLEGALGPPEVGRPNVAPVDRAGHERHLGEVDARSGEGRELAGRGVDRLDPRLGQGGDRLAGVAVRRGDEDVRARVDGGELLPRSKRRGDEVAARRRKVVGGQCGLVELHPFGARGGQLAQKLGVCVDDVVKPVQRRKLGRSAVGRLGEREVCHRADQRGANVETGLPRLGETFDDAAVRQPDRSFGADFRDEVVVVRVEPLCHLLRRRRVVAAGQGEVQIVSRAPGKTFGNGAQEHRDVEDLVVEGERFGNRGGLGQAQLAQPLVARQAKAALGAAQLVRVDFPRPIGFDGALELAGRPDPRVPEDRRGGEAG